MATQWGRKEQIIWQPDAPVYGYGVLAVTALCALFFTWEHYRFRQTAIQRAYTIAYIRATVGAQFKLHGKYQLITLGGPGHKERTATADDFTKGTTYLPDGNSVDTMLSPEARQQGFTFFHRATAQSFTDASMDRWMRGAIFEDKSLAGVYELPFGETLFVFLACLFWSVPRDVRRLRELKYGRRLKGPLLLDPKGFNKEVNGTGLGITTDSKVTVRIPKANEAQHIAIIGDTGTGKSTLIRQFLQQVSERGESAIVYDPACEFVQRFYDPSRGDVILNPLDERCPYWGPAEELRRKAEAKAIAASLYQPTNDKKGEFFTETPQKIFAQQGRKNSHNGVSAAWYRQWSSSDRATYKDRHARISSWPGELVSIKRPNTFAQTCLSTNLPLAVARRTIHCWY